jgi:proliferating cell nuclear antigen PCNA
MKILDLETTHTAPFKILFEVLKDMLTETNIIFRSGSKKTDDSDTAPGPGDQDAAEKCEETDCMKISAIDPTRTVLINVKLEGEHFNKFVCKKKKICIGVNLGRFYKVIKTLNKNDILSLSVDHENKNYLEIKIDSPDEKKNSEFNFKLLDLDEDKTKIPDISFDAVITMESQEFNRLCREMHNIAEYVEIKCLADKIIFTCKGDFTDRKTTYRTNSSGNEDETILVSISHASTKRKDAPQIVQGIFELKNLVLFSKCASLCNEIEIYMKNNFPLIIKYTVASMGRILLCLTPIRDDTTKNSNYQQEAEYYSDQE